MECEEPIPSHQGSERPINVYNGVEKEVITETAFLFFQLPQISFFMFNTVLGTLKSLIYSAQIC